MFHLFPTVHSPWHSSAYGHILSHTASTVVQLKDFSKFTETLLQGRTNLRRQVAGATTFCTVAANVMIGGPQWIFLHASLLTSGILGWRLHFSKSCVPQNCRICLFDLKMFILTHRITDFFPSKPVFQAMAMPCVPVTTVIV